MLYELLTGRVPFRGQTTWETLYQIMQTPLPRPRELNSNIPEQVEAVLVHALARDRDERYATGADLVAALGGAVEVASGEVAGPAPAPRSADAQNRRETRSPDRLVSSRRWRVPRLGLMVSRMVRAARLDDDVYEEIKDDQAAASEAALVVTVTAAASAIGFALMLPTSPRTGPDLVAAAVGGLVGAYAGWALWSFLTWSIGTGIFHGAALPRELLRSSGFAQTPGVLGLLSATPGVGILFYPVVLVWAFLAAVGALKQTLGIGTGKAATTALLAGIPCVILQAGVSLGMSSLAGRVIAALGGG